MTTTSSILKIAAVLAICPLREVASSAVWAFSITELGTARETVGTRGSSLCCLHENKYFQHQRQSIIKYTHSMPIFMQ